MRDGRAGAFAGLAAVWFLGLGGIGAGCGDAFTAGPTDAGTTDASTSDASLPRDAATSDGGTGHDAEPPVVDAGPGFCATQGTGHTFCEDFTAGVPDRLVEIALNASITADTTDYVSAPQSLAASAPKLMKGAASTAFATLSLSAQTGRLFTISSSFKIASSCFAANGQANGVSILAVNFADSDYEVVVTVLPTQVELIEVTSDADGGNMKLSPQAIAAPGLLDTWNTWKLELDASTVPKTATLTVGNVILKAKLSAAPLLALLQHPDVYFGLASRNDSSDTLPACKVGVDDILVDVQAVASPGH